MFHEICDIGLDGSCGAFQLPERFFFRPERFFLLIRLRCQFQVLLLGVEQLFFARCKFGP